MEAFVNGIRMAYDDVGSGPAVLLIHGFPLCRRMWHPQVGALTAAGYRVVTPDLRGFGASETPDGPYSIELFADDLVALLDYLAIERAVVGGMSMGGYVLFNLLERYRSRVAAMICIVTRSFADDEAGKSRRLALAQEVMKVGPQAVADPFVPLLFAPGTETERPKLVDEVYGWMVANDSRGLAGGLLAMRERKDVTGLLSGFTVPGLVIGAAQDRAAPPELSRQLAAGLPHSTLRIIPEAGHLVNLEAPGDFNREVLAFLRSLPAPE